jgi:hypothetical protein
MSNFFFFFFWRHFLKTELGSFTQKKVSMHTVQHQLSHTIIGESVLQRTFIHVGRELKVLYDNRTVEVYL